MTLTKIALALLILCITVPLYADDVSHRSRGASTAKQLQEIQKQIDDLKKELERIRQTNPVCGAGKCGCFVPEGANGWTKLKWPSEMPQRSFKPKCVRNTI